MRVRIGRLWRRWDAFVLVLVATLAVGGVITHAPGVYVAQVDVVLLTPVNGTNAWDGRSRVLTQLAGITARSVSKDLSTTSVVSADVSLAEQGVSQGWQVRQPNEGGQWNYSFSQPILDVQATGPNADFVRDEIMNVVERIRSDITARETAAGVDPVNQVRTLISPSLPQVGYNGGDRRRALMAVVALALLLAGSANATARWYRRRRGARGDAAGDGGQKLIVDGAPLRELADATGGPR